MMEWRETIRRARNTVENTTGISPTLVVVRPEIWSSLMADEGVNPFSSEEFDVEIDGMTVAVADGLNGPFKFYVGVEDYSEEDRL